MTVKEFLNVLEFNTLPIYIFGYDNSVEDDEHYVIIASLNTGIDDENDERWETTSIEAIDVDIDSKKADSLGRCIRIYTDINLPV